jgi:oligopeptidase B
LARTNQSSSDSREETSNRPVVLLGYGAYGESVSLGYDPVLVSLLHKGYVLAFAHTRGGGELGKSWHHAGREARKVKSIEDFEACAFYLKNRWKGKLIMKGFSAAGVIMGATVNRQPTLFDTMVLTNPFLDLYSTMKNPDLPLTIHEWDEFGNPIEDRHMDQLLQSYCPITNVAPETNHYPRCLLIGVLDDQNVPFWNATIFAKKIRDRRINKDMVSLHIEEAGGHHLGQNRLQVAALELAFILQDDES